MKTLGLRLVLWCLVASSTSWAAWPESRLHSQLSFSGIPLPETWSTDRKGPKVGIYVGEGTWDAGKEHLKMFFKEHGFSYRTFTASEILKGEIVSSGIKTIVIPGGQSWLYLRDLGADGGSRIRDFVDQGGGYLGICAGAFYATSEREGGAGNGNYGIGLLEGTAYDGTALGTAPFKEGMLDFEMTSHPLVAGLASVFRIILLGGPSFRYSKDEAKTKHLEVVSNFQKIFEPAMVAFEFGKGRVFLSGPHLEIEEDRTDWGPEYSDPDSEWPILERVTHYVLQDGKEE